MLGFITLLPVLASLVKINAQPTVEPLFNVVLDIGEPTESVESRGATKNAIPITSGTVTVVASVEDEGFPTSGQINGGTIYITSFPAVEAEDPTEGEGEEEDSASEGTSVLSIDFHGVYGAEEPAEGEDGDGESEGSAGEAFFGRQEGVQAGSGQVGRVQVTAGGQWAFLTDAFILCETEAQTENQIQVGCYTVQGNEVADAIEEDAGEDEDGGEEQVEEPVEETPEETTPEEDAPEEETPEEETPEEEAPEEEAPTRRSRVFRF